MPMPHVDIVFHGEKLDAELKVQREKFEVQLTAQAKKVDFLEAELKQVRYVRASCTSCV